MVPSSAVNRAARSYNVDNKSIPSLARGLEPSILNSGQAWTFLAQGWQAADLHVHTLHSYDVIPTRHVDPLNLYLKARRRGMTYVAFTDHDTMAAYDQIGWRREGLVPAVEVHRQGIARVLDLVEGNTDCLVTLDCDGMDPSILPAVLTPVPGGLLYWQVLELLGGLAAKCRIVGFDLVEFMPARDTTGLSALTAARLVCNAIAAIAASKASR